MMTSFKIYGRHCLLVILLGLVFGVDAQADTTTATAPTDVAAATAEAGGGAVAVGQGDPVKGKALWNEHICGSCHNKNMKANLTGPALGGVEERWAAEPREHLYEWVRASQALIASGKSARAKAVWAQWGPTVMSNYPSLSDGDVEHILAFVRCSYDGNCPGATPRYGCCRNGKRGC
ncbi:MAG: cytochrome c [Lewinella sp.]|nr:cytochrome c [Lewinella sp.]